MTHVELLDKLTFSHSTDVGRQHNMTTLTFTKGVLNALLANMQNNTDKVKFAISAIDRLIEIEIQYQKTTT